MGSSNWFHFPKKDAIFFVAIVLYVLLFFLPWTHDVKILNVSLLAWGGALLFLLAPITGIVLALKDPKDN